jgi:hypothetical protein
MNNPPTSTAAEAHLRAYLDQVAAGLHGPRRHRTLLLLHPRPWQGGPAGLVAAIPVIPLVAAALAATATTFATTGRLMRWLPEANPARPWAPSSPLPGWP